MASLCALRSALCDSPLLAMVHLTNPVVLGVLIGWVLTVVLHELGHGVVAYLGGDYTIRERGGLTLNPLQYVHPVNSLLLPAVMLFLGGIPLPGGVTYVRRDLLRSKLWESAVALAGPAVNLILFVLLLLPLHPHFGWVSPLTEPKEWTTAQQVLGALALLQVLAVALNLIPIPPLDGFNAIAPYLGRDVQEKTGTPAASAVGMILIFGLLMAAPKGRYQPVYDAGFKLMDQMGMGGVVEGVRIAYNDAVIGG